jgi:superfamily II DNA or RNA helicase
VPFVREASLLGTWIALPSRMELRFDRGTIVLSAPPPGLDVAQLPGVLWDPRVRVHRAPARLYPQLLAALDRFSGRDDRFSGRLADGVRNPDREPPAGWPEIPLRPYQEAALCAWELADRRGLIVLPTGSGKTRVALAALARTRLRALCLVPTRVLLDQWLTEIGKHYSGPIGCFGDGSHDARPITVATFESAYRYMEGLGNQFDLLVVDEAHHFGCGVRDEALEMSIAGARLGLTATPPRPGPADERLAELVGPRVFELSIGDLTGTFLARFEIIRCTSTSRRPSAATTSAG